MLFRTLLPLRSCLLLLALGTGLVVHAETIAERPSAESFFGDQTFQGGVLSPNAQFMAVIIARKNGRSVLGVTDLLTFKTKVVANLADADIGQFHWVNDERLVFDTTDHLTASGSQTYGPGLFAVNRDSTGFRKLVSRNNDQNGAEMYQGKPLPTPNTRLLNQRGRQDSDFVYVVNFQGTYTDLSRLNTVTGEMNAIRGPAGALTANWLLDQNGEPRIATAYDRNLKAIYYRDPATDQWRKLAEHNFLSNEPTEFSPHKFGPDGTLYVTSRKGGDKAALFAYDLVNNKMSDKALIQVADYDFDGSLIVTDKKILGVHYLAHETATYWLDETMNTLQKSIDTLLPTTVNTISRAPRAQTPFVLVSSSSDMQPPIYMLYNTESKTLTKIGASYDTIKPSQMGHKEMVHYKARDGLDIPAYLTLPPGDAKTNLPLVVLVHGGPSVRGGTGGWDPQTQFLATRGYAVLEPEYRGSTGFGRKHFESGWKQWGLKMQDDVADGAKWAIAQGMVDPKRICIAGASYGGYAALMGLANDPELFKCGIDWAGVTDIRLLYKPGFFANSDMSEEGKMYGLPVLVGDLEKDAAQIKATSPIELAGHIKQPLLLAYGNSDRRVPIVHGLKFRDAVAATNPNVEWVVYEGEGHGWTLEKNKLDFWNRVEKFLDKNIGKP